MFATAAEFKVFNYVCMWMLFTVRQKRNLDERAHSSSANSLHQLSHPKSRRCEFPLIK